MASWNSRIESWSGAEADGAWYAGQPLLVTENDYEPQLYNGDIGVIVQSDGEERPLARASGLRGRLWADTGLARRA